MKAKIIINITIIYLSNNLVNNLINNNKIVKIY